MNVLVVEEDIQCADLLKEHLKHIKFVNDVTHCNTTEQVANLLLTLQVDLILLNISLLGANKLEAYYAMGNHTEALPVIIICTKEEDDPAQTIIECGAQDYIFKDEITSRLLEKSILYAVECKKNAVALNRLNRNANLLFDHNPIPMWAYDVNTLKFIRVNNAATQKYGYTRDEFLNMTILDIRPPEFRQQVFEFDGTKQYNQLRNAGEWVHQKKNGDRVLTEIVSHLADYEGRRIKIVVAYDVTEQVKAKQALEKSEHLFRSVAQSFPNGVISVLDSELNTLYTNGREYQKLHFKPATNLDDNDLLVAAGDNLKVLHGKELKLCLRGEDVEFETSIKDNDYLVTATPLNLSDDFNEKILLVVQNITEKKRVQQQLKLLESVVLNSSNGVVITNNPIGDEPPRLMFANRTMEKITGYCVDEMIGSTPFMFKGDYEVNKFELSRLQESTLAHCHYEGDLKYYKKLGDIYWIHLSIIPVFDDKKVCTHFIGLWTDITQRKKSENEIKKANERYELVSKATNEAILDWDYSSNSITWSHAIQTIFGYEQADAQSANLNWWKKRIHPNDRKRVLRSFTDILNSKSQTRSDEYLFMCKNGNYRPVFDRSFLVYDENTGRPLRMIGSLQDLTDLREKESKLNEQNRKIGEIAQINSHVIRKPVASIVGLLHILDKNKIKDPETNRIIDYLTQCITELDDVIHSIALKAN
jgi:PAS domain S-box-containing protein